MSQMEKEGFGEEFSICSAVFFWRNSGGHKNLRKSVIHVSIRPFCKKGLCQRNLWLAPPPRRKTPPSRRRRESEFVWKNGGKSVGRASRVPPSGFEKAVKFCSGAQERTRTSPVLRPHAPQACTVTNYATWAIDKPIIFKAFSIFNRLRFKQQRSSI